MDYTFDINTFSFTPKAAKLVKKFKKAGLLSNLQDVIETHFSIDDDGNLCKFVLDVTKIDAFVCCEGENIFREMTAVDDLGFISEDEHFRLSALY